MNSPVTCGCHPLFPCRGLDSRIAPWLLICAVFAACGTSALAQLPASTATPASTVTPGLDQTPVPTPTPVPAATSGPTPSDDGQVTLTPGTPDASAEADYTSARTPQASIVLSSPSSGVTNAALNRSLTAGRALAAADPGSTVHPIASGGAFTQVLLVSGPVASVARTTQTAAKSTNNGASSQVPLAVVTLNYGSGWAGQLVFVRPLTNGTVSATDGTGRVYTATRSGFVLTLDAAGTATFGFQSPNDARTYQVYTRLDNVASTLTFVVPDNNL